MFITSTSNQKVKDIVRLRQRSHRDERGLMLIEGYRELKRALDNGYKPLTLFICREFFMGTHENLLIERSQGAEVLECSKDVFAKMSARDRPDGLLATLPQIGRKLSDLKLSPNALIIVAEAIEKPGNLGTILRSSDAAGVEAVIVCDRCTDINNPNVVRASIGTVFSLPVVEASTDETIAFLRSRGVKTVATTPHTDKFYSEPNMTGPTAIIMGSEQYGLSDKWLAAADTKVRIPMLGQCDSLNVAAATTILLFEAQRQRIAIHPGCVPPPVEDEHTRDDDVD